MRVIVILVNGRDNGGRIDEWIAELSTSKEQIVIPDGPTDSKWWLYRQFTMAWENEIIDRIGGKKHAAIAGERHQLFAPSWIGKIPRLGDVDVPSAAGHQKISLANQR